MFPDAQRLLDCSPASTALLDRDGVIVLVNEAWRRFGAANGLRDPSCCVGASYLEVCDRATGDDGGIAAAAARGLRGVMAGGPEFTLEYPCRGQGGESRTRLRARYLETSGHAWVFVTHTDVGGREAALRAAEARVRESELYRAMIDALPDFIFAKDREGRFLAANKATARVMRAGSAADLIGRDDAEFYPPEIAAGFKADEEAFFERGRAVIVEQPGRRLDGSPGRLCSLKAPLGDGQGRIVGYVGHGRDVTDERLRDRALAEARSQLERQAEEMRRLAEAAQEASRAKSDFLAAMSHEIRTPLTGVLGMADLLAAEPLGAKQKGYAEAIRTAGRHLLSIVNDVLDFSRIEAGGLELERIDFRLAELIEQVRSPMAPQATERGLTLRFRLDEGAPPVVRGDPTRLRQLLLNLVGNGLKFTRRGGVAVEVRQAGSGPGGQATRFRFEVRDTGIGIPADALERLFEPFSQGDRSTTRRYGGSGLGLVICKRLVEALGGAIGAESEPDQGSLFWFEVPLELGDEASVEGRTAFDPGSIAPMRVLVAEDVELNRDLLADMLGRHGHEVVFAAEGGAAVAQASAGGFDVVLMDVQMPVMDGVEATRRVRALPPPAGRVPIVGLTANVMAGERERCLAAGMDDCLTKPIVWPDLFAALIRYGTGAVLAPRGRGGRTPGSPPVAADEAGRLAALRAYAVLDTPPEEAFDRIARLAAEIVGTPIALVSLFDERRQWIEARVGLEDVTETPRDQAFCAHTILSDEVLHVPDATRDARFAADPLVTGEPGIRFYVGAPLTVRGGHRLGTLCAIDTRPRGLDERQRQALRDLAALASDQLELRRVRREMATPATSGGGAGPGLRAEDPGERPADAQAPASGRAAVPDGPLVDRAMLTVLGANMPPDLLADFLRRAVEDAALACERFGRLPAGSAALASEAHALRGTSGTFGLVAISALAGEVEAVAAEGGDVSGPVGRLAAAVAATRAELRGAGLLAG